MKILNLTQHNATPDQVKAGVVNVREEDKALLQELLTFDNIPTADEMEARAQDLAVFALTYDITGSEEMDNSEVNCLHVMIGGAPFFMSFLEKALKANYLIPMYAFSKREVIEEPHLDGTVLKKQVFKHLGFVTIED